MFNKKYKKGLADAAKAYEAFGQKQSAALEYILEEFRQGRLDMSSFLQKMQGNIDSVYDHLTSTEKAKLYTVYTPFDIQTLGIRERQFLVGALYRLTMDRLPSEYQQNYLRAVQRYLEIKEPPFGVDPLAIENIESIPFQKAIFQTVVEFLHLQDGDHYDETDLQHNFLESFSLNTKTKQEIFAHVEILFAATGAIGLAEKYGFVPEDEVAEEETVESRKEKAMKNQKEREDAALKIFSLFDNEFGHHQLRYIRSHSIETDNYFVVYLVQSEKYSRAEDRFGTGWLRELDGKNAKDVADKNGLYAINKYTAEIEFLFSYNELPHNKMSKCISFGDTFYLQLNSDQEANRTEIFAVDIITKSIQRLYSGPGDIVSCDGINLIVSTYDDLIAVNCVDHTQISLNIRRIPTETYSCCMTDGKLFVVTSDYPGAQVDCYGIAEKQKLWTLKINETSKGLERLSAYNGHLYLLLQTTCLWGYPGRELYSLIRIDPANNTTYTVIKKDIAIYKDQFTGYTSNNVGQYPDGFLYIRDNDEHRVLGDFKLAFYCFGKETDIELANNCGKRGMTKGGLFSKGELTAKAGYFDRIGDVCFVEIDENGSLARVSMANPMNAVLM